MPNVYVAEKRIEVRPGIFVPDYDDVKEFRWVAYAPYWYFETKEPVNAPPAPPTYPNGQPVWHEHLPDEWLNREDFVSGAD